MGGYRFKFRVVPVHYLGVTVFFFLVVGPLMSV